MVQISEKKRWGKNESRIVDGSSGSNSSKYTTLQTSQIPQVFNFYKFLQHVIHMDKRHIAYNVDFYWYKTSMELLPLQPRFTNIYIGFPLLFYSTVNRVVNLDMNGITFLFKNKEIDNVQSIFKIKYLMNFANYMITHL